ncbi:zinc transporter ZntB [bacterium]|nr:zinc transporter ZntB [bacterium]
MDPSGLIHVVEMDGKGGCRRLSGFDDLASADPQKTIWIHLDRTVEGSQKWLHERSGLEVGVPQALLAEGTRPRSVAVDHSLLVFLRGVNLNPGQAPEDMISLRVWLEPNRIITLRSGRLQASADVLGELEKGTGPSGPGEFLAHLVERLCERMAPIVEDLDDQIDQFYEVKAEDQLEQRDRLSRLRRQIISLRRFTAPQRDLLAALHLEPVPWLAKGHKSRLREASERLKRFVEDLDATREHALIAQDDIDSHFSEQLNRRMYLLSMVAGIFIPLGILTGLFGINVGGIPGSDSPVAFIVFCVALALIVAGEITLFKKMKWL